MMIKFTFPAAFLYRRVASWIRSRTSSSPFPHGTTTRTFPKQTVTFMAFFFISFLYLGWNKKCVFFLVEDLWKTFCESTCHFYIVTKEFEAAVCRKISHNFLQICLLLCKIDSPSVEQIYQLNVNLEECVA